MSLELPFGIKPVNPVAVDYYSGPWSGASTQDAINAANSGIPAAVRFTGLTANLVIAGEAKKYWYASGISDSHLVNFGETLDLATTGNPSGIAFFRADGVITDSTGLTYDSGNYLLNLSGSDPTLELRDSANNDILFQAKDIFNGTGGAYTGGRLLFYYSGSLKAYMQANPGGGMDFPFRLRVSRTGGTTPLLDVNQDGVLVESELPARTTLIAKGAAAQSANLTEWQDSSNTVLAYVDPNGNAGFKNLNVDNMTVSGTFTYVNSENVTISDKQLELASNSGTAISGDPYVDQGGIVLKSTDGDKKWIWVDATNSWSSNQSVFVTGNVVSTSSFQTSQGGYVNTDFINSVRSTFAGARIHLGNSIGGNNKIWLSTLQNPTLVATPSGVGLGTSTPGAALDIRSNGSGIHLYDLNLDNSNYERLELGHDGQFAFMNTASDGSGTLQRVQVRYGGDVRYQGDSFGSYLFQANGHYLGFGNNAFFPNNHNLISLGRNGNRWSDIYGYDLNIEASAATGIAAIIKGAVAQTANLTEWKNSSDEILTIVDESGSLRTYEDVYFYGSGNINDDTYGNYRRLKGSWVSDNEYKFRLDGMTFSDAPALSFDVTIGSNNIRGGLALGNNGGALKWSGTDVLSWGANWLTHNGDTLRSYIDRYADLGTENNRRHDWGNLFLRDVAYTSGINTSGIYLHDNVPNNTAYQLYNEGGELKWNGSAIGGSVSGTPSGVTFFGSDGLLTEDSSFTYDSGNNSLTILHPAGAASGGLEILQTTAGTTAYTKIQNTYNGTLRNLQIGSPYTEYIRFTNGAVIDFYFLNNLSYRMSSNFIPYRTTVDQSLGTTTYRWYGLYSKLIDNEIKNATDVGITVKGAAAQSANLTEWQNSAGENLAIVDSGGNIATSGDITVGFGGNTPEGSVLFPLTDGTFSRIHGTSQGIRVQGYTGVSNMDFDRYFNYTHKTIRPSYGQMSSLGINNQGFGDAYIQRLKLQKSQFANATHLAQNMMEVQNASGYLSMIIDSSGDMHFSSGNNLYFNNYYGDENNYERLEFKWDTNVATIATTSAGTGTDRLLKIQGDGNVDIFVRAARLMRFTYTEATFNRTRLRPELDGNSDLGSSTRRWGTIYTKIIDVEASGATSVPAVIKGAAAQSANLTEWQDSNSTVMASIDPDGNFATSGDANISGVIYTDYIRNQFGNDITIGGLASNWIKINGSQYGTNNALMTSRGNRFFITAEDNFGNNLGHLILNGEGGTYLRYDGSDKLATTNSGVYIYEALQDQDQSPGTAGQHLISTATGVKWTSSSESVSGVPSGVAFFGDDGVLNYGQDQNLLWNSGDNKLYITGGNNAGIVWDDLAGDTVELRQYQSSDALRLMLDGVGNFMFGGNSFLGLQRDGVIEFNDSNTNEAVALGQGDTQLWNTPNGGEFALRNYRSGNHKNYTSFNVYFSVDTSSDTTKTTEFERLSIIASGDASSAKYILKPEYGLTSGDAGSLYVQNQSVMVPTFVVQGGAAQSANLTEWQDSAGEILSKIDSDGHLSIYNDGSTSTDYEQAFLGWDEDYFKIRTSGVGTGSNRTIQTSNLEIRGRTSTTENYLLLTRDNGTYVLNAHSSGAGATKLQGDAIFYIETDTSTGLLRLGNVNGRHGVEVSNEGYNVGIGRVSPVVDGVTIGRAEYPVMLNGSGTFIYNNNDIDEANYERLEFRWDNDVAMIEATSSGTGLNRSVVIGNGDGVSVAEFDVTGAKVAGIKPKLNSIYDNGKDTLRWKTTYTKGISTDVETFTAASDTLDVKNNVALCDCASNSITINLPAASTVSGLQYHVKKTDSSSNMVTIVPDGSETIDGQSSYVVNNQYESITLVCDGSNWFII